MKYTVESILNFNCRVYYGLDKFGNNYNRDLLVTKKSGQVAVIFNSDDEIVEAKVFKNRAEAYAFTDAKIPSRGITG